MGEIYRKDLGIFVGTHFLFGINPERKQAIYNFNDKFGITEDDIAIDTLTKHLQRHEQDTKFFEFQ